MSLYIGLDIGGTKFMVAAADAAGRELARVREDTPADLREGLELLHAMIARVAGGAPIAGIGGGFVVDGRLYRGASGAHPEIGHQAVPMRCAHPERVVCECGASDCLEALASGNGIHRVYGKPAEELNGGEWAEVAYHLGQALRNLATIYAPGVITLGGGVAVGGGERLLGGIRATLAAHARLVPLPDVRQSILGYDTALRGAISIAIDGLEPQISQMNAD